MFLVDADGPVFWDTTISILVSGGVRSMDASISHNAVDWSSDIAQPYVDDLRCGLALLSNDALDNDIRWTLQSPSSWIYVADV
jgi:hypothetical protein